MSECVGGTVGARGGDPPLGWFRSLIPMEMSVILRREDDEGTRGLSFLTRATTTIILGSGYFPQ